MKTCTKCNETTDNFYASSSWCRPCKAKKAKQYRTPVVRTGLPTPTGKLAEKAADYKRRAKNKGLVFELSTCDFVTLQHAHCEYCGGDDTLGFDRIDSSKGYVQENVTACCKTCNIMKNTLSYGEFVAHINKIQDFSLGGL